MKNNYSHLVENREILTLKGVTEKYLNILMHALPV